MDELPDVPALRVLEPPPGGLERLRERLARPHRRWWLVAVPALAVAVAVLLVFVGRARAPLPTPTAAASALPDREVAGDGTFYWVASTPGATHARRPAISIDAAPTVTDYALP